MTVYQTIGVKIVKFNNIDTFKYRHLLTCVGISTSSSSHFKETFRKLASALSAVPEKNQISMLSAACTINWMTLVVCFLALSFGKYEVFN